MADFRTNQSKITGELSEMSDVNSDEMARMVRDMDDLDSDLFGSSLKKQKPPAISEATDSAAQTAAPGTGKRVLFHDFNEDDPLADLLSDEEEFQAKPKPATARSKNGLMSDLFGIKTTDPLESNVKQSTEQIKSTLMPPKAEVLTLKPASRADDWLGLMDDPPAIVKEPESTLAKTKPKVKSGFDNDEDILASLAEKPRTPGDKTKKSSLMEDLFGDKPRSNPLKETYPRRDAVKLGLETPAAKTKLEQSKVDLPSNPGATRYAPQLSGPREPRRGRRSSGIIADPLGMFETSTPQANALKSDYLSSKLRDDNALVNETEKPVEIQKDDLPDWLGGPKKSKDNRQQNENGIFQTKTKPSDQSLNTSITDANVSISQNQQTIANGVAVVEPSVDFPINYPEHMSMLVGSQFDQQASMISLQHQENELRTATALSRHSEQLARMLELQTVRLNEQDKQFNQLIKRQIDRQTLLEAQMKAQQDRINSHIQVLLAQPSSVPVTTSLYQERAVENVTKETETESLVQKLQLEKLYLENTLESLKEKHDKEIAIIEESYKKQISHLEEAMEKLEKRLRQDAELAEADYEARILKLKDSKISLELVHVEEIDSLKKEHAEHIQEIYDRQRHNTEMLQKEHAETIENIGKAKELERQAVGNTVAHGTAFGDMLRRTGIVMDGIEDLQQRFDAKDGKIEKAREIFLKMQEEELKVQKEQLRKQQDALEFERKQLIEAVQKLEAGSLQLVSESQKWSADNKEAEDRLRMREQSLIRDRELLDEQIHWERSHIQAIKDAWMREQERQSKQLNEERHALASEKAKLEVLNRLKTGSDDVAKAELEAAVRVAQDAANDAVQERQKWRERLSELELKRQHIREKENQLTLRAKELEDLTQSALEKREEGLRALREARSLEEQHRDHLGQLQMQLEGLAQRENKLATEKLALARERLALRIGQADKPEKDPGRPCLPHSYKDQTIHYNPEIPPGSHTVTHFKDIVDPNLVLLKIGLDNELSTSNECLAAMHTISQ